MKRLTYYDYLAECYKVRPDAPQGQIIQRLGRYEDTKATVNNAALQTLLEAIRAEKLDITTIKGEEWRAGYIEGLNVADEIIRGALDDN